MIRLVKSQDMYSLRYQSQFKKSCFSSDERLVVFNGNFIVTDNYLVVRKPLLLSA